MHVRDSYLSINNVSTSIILSLFIAIYFVFFDSLIESIFGIRVDDRSNYIFHIKNIDYELAELSRNFSFFKLSTLFGQNFYYPTLYFLENIYFFGFNTVYKIIFFTSFTYAFYIFRYTRFDNITKIIILIFCEIIITNYANALRQGFACSFFLIGFFSKNKFIRYFFIFYASQIHYLFFIPLFLLSLIKILKIFYVPLKKDVFFFIIVITFPIFLLLLFFLQDILNLNYHLMNNYSHLIFKININKLQIFILVIFLSILYFNHFNENTIFISLLLIFYLSISLFFSPISRLPMALSPLILIESSNTTKSNFHIKVIWLLYSFFMLLNLLINQNLNNIAY